MSRLWLITNRLTQFIERTAICSFRALFLSRLGIRITNLGTTLDCARGARRARCDSTFAGASRCSQSPDGTCVREKMQREPNHDKCEIIRLSVMHYKIIMMIISSSTSPNSMADLHIFGAGLVSASQLSVLHLTVPGMPDPAAIPHSVAHPVGSAGTQSPGSTGVHGNTKLMHS